MQLPTQTPPEDAESPYVAFVHLDHSLINNQIFLHFPSHFEIEMVANSHVMHPLQG
jgi:hypothetical protein